MMTSFFGDRSRPAIIVMGAVGVLVVGVADYFSGTELSFSIFYLMPVGLMSWFGGRHAGLAFSAVSALVWMAADLLPGHEYAHAFYPYWNMSVRLGFFMIVSLALVALRTAHDHERNLARTDSLTGIANSRLFQESVADELERSRRNRSLLTAVYLDVDYFKEVNDRFGHAAGDEVLRVIATALATNIRRTDIVARLGGDEFAMLLPHTGACTVDDFLERVRRQLLEATEASGWPVTFSIGAVTFTDPPADVDELIRIVDKVMYEVKNGSKDALRHEIK